MLMQNGGDIMSNYRKTLFGFTFLFIILCGCGEGVSEEAVNATKSTVTESSNDKTDAEAEESKSDVEEKEVSFPDIGLYETKTIIDDLIEEITTVYVDTGLEHKLADNPLTDKVYASMAKEFKPFATDRMIETQLHDIAGEFCYAGCDAYFFPRSPLEGLQFSFINSTNEKVTLEYIVPENELTANSRETITLINVDGDWKLDSFDRTFETFNLSQEEAETILTSHDEYQDFRFVEMTTIEDKNVFVFQVNGSEAKHIGVYKETGYLVNLDDRYTTTNSNISTQDTSSAKYRYLHRMDELEDELAWIDDQYEIKSVAEMRNLEEQRYQKWDDILNEVYSVLQDKLPSDEMDALKEKQIEWITYRDTEAEKGIESLGGGWQSLQYTINLVHLTKERCYELVENYL